MDVIFDTKNNSFNMRIISNEGSDYMDIDLNECIPIHDSVIIAGVRHQICNYLISKKVSNFLDMRYLRNSGCFGSIFVTCLHFYPIME